MTARTVAITADFAEWLKDEEPILSTDLTPDLLAFPVAPLTVVIRRGVPYIWDDLDGAALYVSSEAGDWLEWYPRVPDAAARFAALVKCVEDGELFRDGPEAFTVRAQEFFSRTTTQTPNRPPAL